MYPQQLIGKEVLRKRFTISGDQSFTKEVVKIIDVKGNVISYEMTNRYSGEKNQYSFEKEQFLDDNWVLADSLFSRLHPKAMEIYKKDNPLIGELCIRKEPTKDGSEKFLNKPCLILAMTENHILFQYYKDITLKDEIFILDYRFVDDKWMLFSDLMDLGSEKNISLFKTFNPLLGEWCVRTTKTRNHSGNWTREYMDEPVRIMVMTKNFVILENDTTIYDKYTILRNEYQSSDWKAVNKEDYKRVFY